MIYLDNAATTAPLLELRDLPPLYNPSSLHGAGLAAEEAVKAASRTLAEILRVSPEELIFTSGATESNNTAILGALTGETGAPRGKAREIITTEIEHPSVTECFHNLEKRGFKGVYLKADETGRISRDELLSAVSPQTALVSLFYVHNETGVINDIPGLAAEIKAESPETLIHTDAAQAFGKISLNLKNVDFASFCAHKIHGGKGAGGLLARKALTPLMLGGGQQNGRRSGTVNAESIRDMAFAADFFHNHYEKFLERAESLRKNILQVQEKSGITVIDGGGRRSPYILSLSVPGARGEVLLNALSAEGIYVSAGSACNSRRQKAGVIRKINPRAAEGSLRVSFAYSTTPEECEAFKEALLRHTSSLRRN
ncbi:MAG: cysteine desulfurase [Clostridiales bacterium]|jgi:cysteine desulfurase|nr:cysteine desulfurase [Clostridiales bacterium]